MLTKEEVKHINSIDKEMLYFVYTNISGGLKSYERITRKQMIEDIYADISYDNYYLKRTVLKKDLKLLIEAIKNGLTTITASRNSLESLVRLNNAFLIFNIKYPQLVFHIPDDIIYIFKDYDLSEFDEQVDEFFYFMNGLLYTRGIVNINEAKEIFLNVKPKDFQIDFNETLNELSGQLLGLVINEYEYFNLLIKASMLIDLDVDELAKRKDFSFDEYLSYGKYGFNLIKEVDLKAYQILSNYLENDFTFEAMSIFITDLNKKDSKYGKAFSEIFLMAFEGDKQAVDDFYDKFVEALPRWSYKGNLKKDIKTETTIKFAERVRKQKQDKLPTCVCGSSDSFLDCCGNKEKLLKNKAILDDELGQKVYETLYTYMYIINDALDLFPVKEKNAFFDELTHEQFVELKQKTLEYANDILYAPESPEQKQSDIEIMVDRGFKNNYQNYFFALKYIDQKLLLYDEELSVLFLVSGITSPLSEGVPFYDLPRVVKTTLIPLENEIIYDIFLERVEERLDDKLIKTILDETKDLDVCSDFDSFVNYVGIVEEIDEDDFHDFDDDDDDDVILIKKERLDLKKTINEMKVKLIRLNEDNIDNYINIWVEVLQSMRGIRSYQDALRVLNVFKDHFYEMYQSTTLFDYRPLARVLEVNGKVVGFVSGILSYFESGIMFQIGTFGISARYRKKGYGKIFVEMLKEDMKEFNVNYLWLLPQNDGFWYKQGFSADSNLMNYLYSLSITDKPLILKLSDQAPDFKTFLELFYDADGGSIPYIRDERSLK